MLPGYRSCKLTDKRKHHMVRRRHLLAGAAGAFAAACAAPREVLRTGFALPAPLVPLRLDENRLVRITVCTRPFRPAGPRLEAEAVDGRVLVHNYGHGGSGWSLSWGCAAEATALALAGGHRQVAIVGAGVIGLTTALRLAETGAEVTIYAREFPMETRSARATGVWSPSSRVGLADAVDSAFSTRWEDWARRSFDAHQRFVGVPGDPVEYLTQYYLPEEPRPPRVPARHDFLHLEDRIGDLTPAWSDLPAAANPFPVERARSGLGLVFNVASYAQALTTEFRLRGGRMLRRDLPDRAAVLALSEPVVINCTGYAAAELFSDRSLVPVRGQINWLAPQPEARYGVFHREVAAVSRRDGVVVQYVGPNDDWGFGDAGETPDRTEMSDALARLRPLFRTS
jgi:glycine/D-amino acid oxidase-like deaminating enzyme